MVATLEEVQTDNPVFILATGDEFDQIAEVYEIGLQQPTVYGTFEENVRFESYPNFDFLSFIFFHMQDMEFQYQVFNLFYGENFLVLIISGDESQQTPDFIKEFNLEEIVKSVLPEKATYIYYKILSNSFTQMFETMCQYEEQLEGIENDILTQQKDFPYEKILSIKNNSSEIKKCLRFLLYVGDQLMVNDNGLIPENGMRFFRNIDMRINRLYEYASSLQETSQHLMELYDSAVNARTNATINKLTVFTLFATPISMLTGLYGMNFVNMPELQFEYGYFVLLGVIATIWTITFIILKRIKLL